jgi:hypothetical protein
MMLLTVEFFFRGRYEIGKVFFLPGLFTASYAASPKQPIPSGCFGDAASSKL